MLIKNLTDQVQELHVRELRGSDRVFSVYIQPQGVTDLDRLFVIVDKEKVGKVVEVVGVPIPKDEPKEVEAPKEESRENEVPPEESPKPEILLDKFICDECGAEFASARGLNNHKNKAHTHAN